MDIGKHFKHNWKNYLIGILVVIVVFGGLLNALVGMSGMGTDTFSKSLAYDAEYSRNSYYYDDGGFAPDSDERKVIRNANMNLESDNYDVAKTNVDRSVIAHSVIVLSQTENKYKDDYRNSNYRFKVPSSSLDLFLEELKGYGEVQYYNVYSNDVTGTYADYSARLERKQLQIQRYEARLASGDMEVEDEISLLKTIDSLEDEIFSLNKRISNIDEDVTYSDVSLSLKEEPSVWSEIDFLGLKDGFKLFVASMEGAIRTILVLAGFLLPFVLIYGVYRGLRKLF